MARLAGIWRHPVKSFQGERLVSADVAGDGIHGDRSWGVRDEATGRILTARREPQLLLAAASLGARGEPELTLPGGVMCDGLGAATDRALSEWLGRPVALVAAGGAPGATAEFFADATDDTSTAIEWTMPPGRFVDAMPLLLLTTASLATGTGLYPGGDWDVRRFRPNLLIETDQVGWLEDDWCSRTVHVGTVVMVPREPCVRCTMVTRPQPDLERDLDIYRTLARHHAGHLGVWTTIDEPGTLQVGDDVVVE
jgi:uncharacterized protein YcbX